MDVQAILRARQDAFVEKRTRIESEVNKFLESVNQISDERVTSIPGRPTGNTCREVLPELWNEPFNQEVYDAELAVLNDYVAKVQAVCDSINEEALRCLQSE